MRLIVPILVVAALTACAGGDGAKSSEELAAEKCPKVHVDRMAGDWVLVQGASADGKTRLRLEASGDGYKAFYVGGFFTHLALDVEKRDRDLKLTEIPSARKKVDFDAIQNAAHAAAYSIKRLEIELDGEVTTARCNTCEKDSMFFKIGATGQLVEIEGKVEPGAKGRLSATAVGFPKDGRGFKPKPHVVLQVKSLTP